MSIVNIDVRQTPYCTPNFQRTRNVLICGKNYENIPLFLLGSQDENDKKLLEHDLFLYFNPGTNRLSSNDNIEIPFFNEGRGSGANGLLFQFKDKVYYVNKGCVFELKMSGYTSPNFFDNNTRMIDSIQESLNGYSGEYPSEIGVGSAVLIPLIVVTIERKYFKFFTRSLKHRNSCNIDNYDFNNIINNESLTAFVNPLLEDKKGVYRDIHRNILRIVKTINDNQIKVVARSYGMPKQGVPFSGLYVNSEDIKQETLLYLQKKMLGIGL